MLCNVNRCNFGCENLSYVDSVAVVRATKSIDSLVIPVILMTVYFQYEHPENINFCPISKDCVRVYGREGWRDVSRRDFMKRLLKRAKTIAGQLNIVTTCNDARDIAAIDDMLFLYRPFLWKGTNV